MACNILLIHVTFGATSPLKCEGMVAEKAKEQVLEGMVLEAVCGVFLLPLIP